MHFQCPKCLMLCQDAAELDCHEAECSVSVSKDLAVAQDSAGGAEVIDLESGNDDGDGKQGYEDTPVQESGQPVATAEDTLPVAQVEEGETKENEWLMVWTVSEI